MIGGRRFALARARAALPALVTLLIVTGVAAGLIVGMAVALRAVEAQDVRAALGAADGLRGQAVVSVADGGDDGLADAVRQTLAAHGAPAVTVTESEGVVTITPDPARVTGDDVVSLIGALRELPSEAREAVGARVQVAGGLPATLGSIADGLQARRGPTAVAIGFLGLLTVVVVGAVALEPVRARSGESLLLRARGARARSLAALSGAETAAVSSAGSLAGAGVVLAVAHLAGLPHPGLLFAAVGAAGVALAATLVAVVVTARTADRRPGRAQLAAAAAVAVVLAVVTGLAAWQFAQSGSPVVARGDGTAILDPLVAIAPALVLALAALLAVLVATPVARGIAAALAATRGVQPITPLRLASRRPGRHALPITVVAFAVGTATVAGAYLGTTRALGDAPEALRVGADVRVTTIPETLSAADIAVTATEAGARATAAARGFTAIGPGARIPVVAIDGGAVGDVLLNGGGTIDPAAIGEAIRLPDAGIPLAGDDLELVVTAPPPPPIGVDGEQFQPEPLLVNVQLTFRSDAGTTFTYGFVNGDAGSGGEGGEEFVPPVTDPRIRERIPLPGEQTWSLLAIEVWPAWWGAEGTVVLSDVVSGGEPLDLSTMSPAPGTAGSVEIAGGIVFAPAFDSTGDGLVTSVIAPGVPAAAPIVITSALADDLSLAPGDTIALEFDGPDFEADVVVAGVVPVLPGTPAGQGLLADLGTLRLLAATPIVPNQLWARADAPDAVAGAIADANPGATVLVADPRQGEAAAATAWGFGLAAAGGLVLAVVVLALRRTRSRADTRELALLAVMGLGRRRAAATRTAEDLFALALGVLGGVAAGIATAWLVVPTLVRAAYGTVPDAYPVPLVWPAAELAVAVGAIALVCAAVSASVRVPRTLAPALREDE
ncbi:hypothetical protein [Microbacterium sp. T2.11-28]|uniref:hypothetical protein n=1 Tax=Microbacterium sp. T2.11-28 TaxID=3041169 RepID=UPI0024774529|nr:hypothetical protein [Microbacterium sp. T2.11-28]CAI9394541.1 hypothetical protein MICABA_02818 [Microbacterium sp. T2.11-28]